MNRMKQFLVETWKAIVFKATASMYTKLFFLKGNMQMKVFLVTIEASFIGSISEVVAVSTANCKNQCILCHKSTQNTLHVHRV